MTALAVVGLGVGPAAGDPGDPANSSDAMKKYQDLSKQSQKVNEDLLKAKDDLRVKQGDLARADAAIAQARAAEGQARAAEEGLRGEVDAFTAASFKGAQFDTLSAVLNSGSTRDFLDRATALDMLATQRKGVLDRFRAAVTQTQHARTEAEVQQQRAKEASDAAAKLTADAERSKRDLDGQINQVRAAMNKLSASEKQSLKDPGDLGSFLGIGAANTALQSALAQRGKPYVWGATGPNAYDCSGLTSYAYKQAGVGLPRSARAQYGEGRSVSKSELQPGDLLFYGDSASSIHHVAMYVGSGKIVHASTEGEPVKVAAISGGGTDFFGARRIVG